MHHAHLALIPSLEVRGDVFGRRDAALRCFQATLAGVLSALAQLSSIVHHPPAALEEALQRLGSNVRTARLRRRLRLEDVAERMGVSRFTVADVERGKPGTSIAAYLGALWALVLLDQLAEVADPDRDAEGKTLEAARQPCQAARQRRFDDDF